MGAAAIFARFALSGAGPLAVSAARLAIATAALFLIALLHRRSDPRPSPHARVIFAIAGLALAAHFATWIASLDDTSVAVSTLLVATTPLFTAAYDAVAHRRMLAWPAIAAYAGGGVGLYLVAGLDRTAAPHPGHEVPGALLALSGAAAFAAYLILVRGAGAGLPTRTIVTHTYGWATVALVIAAAIAREAPPAPSNVPAWGGIVAMALISQLLGHTAINASLRRFSPSTVSFANLLEPVFAAVLALAIFHESIPPSALAGGALILASVLVVLRIDPIPESA